MVDTVMRAIQLPAGRLVACCGYRERAGGPLGGGEYGDSSVTQNGLGRRGWLRLINSTWNPCAR
jgi:hypothetical protein